MEGGGARHHLERGLTASLDELRGEAKGRERKRGEGGGRGILTRISLGARKRGPRGEGWGGRGGGTLRGEDSCPEKRAFPLSSLPRGQGG